MKTTLVISALALAISAHAVTFEGNTVTLSSAEIAECKEGGGCVIVSKLELQAAMQNMEDQFNAALDKISKQAFEAGQLDGYKIGAQACKKPIPTI